MNMKLNAFFSALLFSVLACGATSAQTKLGKLGGEQASSCPCESSVTCQGPRGGKYCVTKRGNKKYLKRVKR
jgi:hypothetical protein